MAPDLLDLYERASGWTTSKVAGAADHSTPRRRATTGTSAPS